MATVPIAKQNGNVFVGSGERLALSEAASKEEEAQKMIELKKKARAIQVSTEDHEVKAYLRQLGEPICLFGEDPANRRDRLKMILALSGGPAVRPELDENGKPIVKPQSERDDNTVWYHEGTENLRSARMWLAEFSLARAKLRLERARKYFAENPESQRLAKMHEYDKKQRTIGLLCSQVGDSRPLVHCSFSPNCKMLATASWSGLCKLWAVPSLECVANLRGHQINASCIAWHPNATLDQPKEGINLASCAHDGSVKLWSLDSEEPLADIEGHAPNRVSRLAFHPSGRFLATTCHDKSWRLWDLEACEEILHQEGHSRAVYDVKFHPDGSLAMTSSLDSYARMWDLRSGRCIMFLEGHLEDCVGVDIADNGVHALTCSVDNTVRIWDLRQQQTIYTILAHSGVVSCAKFEPQQSKYIVSTSFDGSAKVWGHPVWTPLRKLDGHCGRITYGDISFDSKYIATCSHDMTVKLWTRDVE